MLELPEAAVISAQLNETICAKTIRRVVAAQSPHKFAWYTGDPAAYPDLLTGKTISASAGLGGMIEIQAGDLNLVFSDGVNLRYHTSLADLPPKHQLLLEFEDDTALCATVAMYGGLVCFPRGENDNPYYQAAVEKPSPLTDAFTAEYFAGLFLPQHEKLSLKAFLATEQRIPGLGNGVLQDILYRAKLHPKQKVAALDHIAKDSLYASIKTTLADMVAAGGRDTERNLYGDPGGYHTRVSKNTVGQPCPECGSTVQKQAYMGGSIYFCPGCQKVD
jgi:formamidopyrimidine-DNA glycosylase